MIEVRANTWFIPLIAISFLSFGKVSINIYCKNVCWVVILVVSFDWHFVSYPLCYTMKGKPFKLSVAAFQMLENRLTPQVMSISKLFVLHKNRVCRI